MPRSLPLALAAACLSFAAVAAPAGAHPGHAEHAGMPGAVPLFSAPFPKEGPSAGGYSSNVEFVKNLPQHADSAGARKLGEYFYITTERDLTIYDVSTPADPKQVGHMFLPDPGTPVYTEEDPDTNGRILIVSNGGKLSVIDVTDKTAPTLLSQLDDADEHTVSCVLDCTWAYGSHGMIVDLRDPAKPKLSKNVWKTPDIESFHDVTEVSPGIVVTSSQPIKLLDARTTPEQPAHLQSIPKEKGRFVHANLWPRGGADDYLLVGGEDIGPGCSESQSATFSTWDARQWRETGAIKQVDEFRLRPGTVTDGRAPESSFCVHWFDEHPAYDNGGLVAIGWYEHGTHFLRIGSDGTISEVGWFIGGGGQSSAAYWIDERTVYVADYVRGLDVLRFTGDLTEKSVTAAPATEDEPANEQREERREEAQAEQASNAQADPACTKPAGFGATSVERRGSRLELAFDRTSTAPVLVDVFQQSVGRRVIGERLIARFTGRDDDVVWNGKANRPGRKVTDGYYFVRYRTQTPTGVDTRRIALRRAGGEWTVRPWFYRPATCDLVPSFKLERPVFGGRTNRALGISYRVARQASVTVTVLRGTTVVKRFPAQTAQAGRTYRLRLGAAGRPRGDYRVRLDARRGAERVAASAVSRRL
jgi:hypothetical protein